MNKKVLKTLEFDKIIELLTEKAQSAGGKELCRQLEPTSDREAIRRSQQQTDDALKRIFSKGSISFSGVKDIRPSLKRIAIGASLGITELLEISSLLTVALRVKTFSREETEDGQTDSLDEMFFAIEPLSNLNQEITRCILGPEEIADDASPTLKHIRRSIRLANDSIHSQLSGILTQAASKSYLQDSIITMRNGRYCIPVKQEYKNHVPGLVHDQSSTGSTFFIEPMAIVKLNNELKELASKEQEEIAVILASLSNEAALYKTELEQDYHLLTELDFIFAKASLAKAQNATMPVFSDKKYLNIKAGRHPLLDPKKVVPIDVYLGDAFDLLIITGPNTGGKTVSLKTVGLFTLMGQAGLHIPAFEGSTLAIFDDVYADIGDEQSIEQNLSTFSSHMTNVVRIIKEATPDSLVLFDELGSGTDPVEGAALAMSILTFLHNMQVRTMATTHYSELKLFALSTPGVSNACCEFDVATLRPTYHLLIGIPGKSNAFAISSKLGLPDYLIEDAKNRIHEDNIAFEDVVSELEKNRSELAKEREELERLKKDARILEERYKKQSQELTAKKDDILRKAREQASNILGDAKEFADHTIKEMNRLKKQGDTSQMEKVRQNAGKKLSNTESKMRLKKTESPKKKHTAKDFKIGDRVKVHSLGLEGSVSTLPNQKGDLYVQMGILRSLVNIKDLEILDEPVITAPTLTRMKSGKMKATKSSYISQEINLLGMTTDEAIARLDKYLDDAYLSSLSTVRVVHGKGTGALRKAVHEYLRRQKHVKSYRLGEYGEGDAGVTIVEFK